MHGMLGTTIIWALSLWHQDMHLCIFKKEEEDRKKLISIMCLKEVAKTLFIPMQQGPPPLQ